MKTENLKIGSVVRMSFSTYANRVNQDWKIIKNYIIDGEDFVDYVADCKVSNVSEKFFRVIIPHSNSESVRFSKRCFIDTTYSYADSNDFRPEIISY